MRTSCSVSFSACIAGRTSRAQALDWPPFSESSTNMAAVSGLKRKSIRALRSISVSGRTGEADWTSPSEEHHMNMTSDSMEILLVEDDPQDVQLTLRVFRGENLNSRIHIARDGEEALDFLF